MDAHRLTRVERGGTCPDGGGYVSKSELAAFNRTRMALDSTLLTWILVLKNGAHVMSRDPSWICRFGDGVTSHPRWEYGLSVRRKGLTR